MTRIFALALAAATAGSAGTAWADPIYQSIPDLTVAPVVRGYCSGCGLFREFRIYDRFTLGAPGVVDSVTFAVDRQNIAGSSLNIGFFTPNGTRPGAQIASYDISFADIMGTQQDTALENVFLYTATIGGLALGSGTYDISFFNPNGLSIPAYEKAGGTLYQSGTFFFGENFYQDRAAAFSLNALAGAVPEPATWGLMIIGFGLAGGMMRRRRAAVSRVAFAS